MKRLLLITISMGLFYITGAQVLSPVMTGNVTGQKVLSDRNVSFNVVLLSPTFYKGGTSTKLQVGFPYNALYYSFN
ncbi:MAG: hypothetical protein IPF54_02910 [Draconibacterium sp.]|nr:hypothetical protein [Draconibacterium sp.]